MHQGRGRGGLPRLPCACSAVSCVVNMSGEEVDVDSLLHEVEVSGDSHESKTHVQVMYNPLNAAHWWERASKRTVGIRN